MGGGGRFSHHVAEGVADLLYPHRCVLCDLPGTVLCESCMSKLDLIDTSEACPACGAPHGRESCTECFHVRVEAGGFSFSGARAAGSFDAAFSRIITAYKDLGERGLAEPIGRLMAAAAGPDWRAWADAVTFVPASRDAFIRRGFDHMHDVAKRFADHVRAPLFDVLIRDASSSVDQRALSREERRANAARSFTVAGGEKGMRLLAGLEGRHVILLDDVFTTGATLDAASRALLDRGVGEVRVCVLARVW